MGTSTLGPPCFGLGWRPGATGPLLRPGHGLPSQLSPCPLASGSQRRPRGLVLRILAPLHCLLWEAGGTEQRPELSSGH